MRRSIVILIAACLFLLSVFPSFAAETDIVINEVFPDPSGDENKEEFIELFNKGTESVTLTNWTLSDKVKSFNIPETILDPGKYTVFLSDLTKISLNNSGDEVFLKKTDQAVVDQMSYDQSIEDKSWSRIPNGVGSFMNNAAKTSGSVNEAPPTLTPTHTPSPEPTNTPTKTPTPTKIPTPKPTEVVKSSNTPTPKSLTSSESEDVEEKEESEEEVLGENTSNPDVLSGGSEKAEEVEESPTPIVKGESKANMVTNVFITVGFLLLSSVCGILLYRGFKKQKEGEI